MSDNTEPAPVVAARDAYADQMNLELRQSIAAQVLTAMDVDQYLIDAVRNATPPLPALVASEAFVVPLEDPNDPSADEWVRLDAANAEGDAIEALVEEFSDEIRQDREERWAAPDIKARLRQFAIRVRQVPS